MILLALVFSTKHRLIIVNHDNKVRRSHLATMLEYSIAGGRREKAMGDLNIYQMCEAHGGPGFWVRRDSWADTCARVVAIGTFTRPGPYYGNPPVLADIYSMKGEAREGMAVLSCPGTYGYELIAPPVWVASAKIRDLEDPALIDKLQSVDKRKAK